MVCALLKKLENLLKSKAAIAIIQARMSSTRLPGKVMLPLNNKPLIQHIVDRLMLCKEVGHIVIATSDMKDDDEIYKYCKNNNIDCYRGSLANVLSRFVGILKNYKYEFCVRITGDCPLIHPPFIDAQIEALKKNDGDLIWIDKQIKVLEGQGVISRRAISNVFINSNDPEDLEHVGSKYFLSNINFKYVKLIVPQKYYKYNYRLCLDEKKDYDFLKYIFNQRSTVYPENLDDILQWLDTIEDSKIINKSIEHSQINKKINNQKLFFKPNIIASFSWNNA
tara:strand:+ start:460 stop:1299 length:840 start_codon:yes stop_codon:yes gene_type:complete